MRKIKIKKNTNGDSRVAKQVPTHSEFMDANYSHRREVADMMDAFAEELSSKGRKHDWTKIDEPYSSMFYRDLCNTIEGKMEFMEGQWANLHYNVLERHHLNRNCPEDVNLFDVIEMLCDCVCAGAARSGDFYDITVSPEILEKAVNNTVKILKNNVEIEDE